MDEVIEFINRRFKATDANWCHGNCYWFAKILCDRFDYLDLYYEPIIGHFYAGIDNRYYDYTGKVTNTNPLLFSKINELDDLWYQHITRDCIL